MSRTNHSRAGFTIIELLLAMSLVAVLLLLILTATFQIVSIYNKGITLKGVNQAGASIGSELQSSLSSASAPLTTGATDHGRLCLGTYSYVWNIRNATANQYDGDGSTPIGLVKVADTSRAMCAPDGGGAYPAVPKDGSRELLKGVGANIKTGLELRDFSVSRSAQSGQNYVYTVDYTISTDGGDLITTDDGGTRCTGGIGDEFCALNSFSFKVFMRTNGVGSGS